MSEKISSHRDISIILFPDRLFQKLRKLNCLFFLLQQMAMFNGCGSGDVHQYNGCGQAHQISKLVFSLTETNPARRNVLTANSQTISDDISQLGHWPYAVENIRGSGSPACPYVQLRMDVYVRPLRNQADFTIEVEIFQREAWQNQICCQRILQLLRYCIGN